MGKKLFCGAKREAVMCAHITERINRLKAFRWTVVDVVLFKIAGLPFL